MLLDQNQHRQIERLAGIELECFADPLLGSALALGMRTLVGPLYIGVGFGEGGRRQAYFLVGRGI